MSVPLVSVLIPCFNAARYVGATLESVFRQTWPEIEIVVVNDGSSDDSLAEIGRLARPNLRLVDREQRGAAASRNEALALSRGEFVQFLDADDVMAPDKIALQMGRLAGRQGCVASAEWGRFHHDPAETRFVPEPVWRDLDPLDWLALSRADGEGMLFPALWLIPHPIALAAGPWAPELTLADDTEYFTRVLLHAKRVLFCEGARVHYRSGVAGSLSGRKTKSAWASQFEVTARCERQILAREDSERMRRGFALSWQHLAHAAYPYDRGLATRALQRARALHPVCVSPDGGTAFRIASRLVGWRVARLLQVASGRP